MVDTSSIDILALIECKAGIRTVGKLVRVRGVLEIHSNCPWCPGTEDSFIIKPEEGTYSHAIRQRTGNGCGRHGDAIDFLYEWEGTSFLDACEELGIPLDGKATDVLPERKRYKPEYSPQSKKWRDTAEAKLSRAQTLIRTGVGLEYARSRGLSDETILDWRLGYVPFRNEAQRFFTLDPDEWGIDRDKKYFMYEGLLIPWFVKKKIWKLQVRRVSGQIDSRYKILPVKGSVEHCLFNQDSISADKPVMLVESALCAISGNQEGGDLATFVATGGTKANQYAQNVSLLACAPVVLVAFDDDANCAGDAGADYWMKALPNAFRWLPWDHDVNAMLVEGKDIRAWVEIGLISAALEERDQVTKNAETPFSFLLDDVPPVLEEGVLPDEILALIAQTVQLCCACLDLDPSVETPAVGEYEGTMYCAEHFPRVPLTQGQIVEQLRSELPGWKVILEPRTKLRQKYPNGKWLGKTSVPDEVWLSLPRGAIWQEILEGSYLLETDSDYWAATHTKLQAFLDQLNASDQELLHVRIPPRVYADPVPRYELQEDESGVKRVVVVGYWEVPE